jgi:muramoyltetrapeptide carboxypeptidase
VREPYRYLAASDDDRCTDLVAAFSDPSVRAVWFARGGYGMARLLPRIDPALLRDNVKLCIGFSDATALLQQIAYRARIPAIHGPMVAHDLPRQEASGGLDHLLGIAAGRTDWRVPVPRAIRAGAVAAPLLGGCLTVLASLAGTPYAPRFAGAIALLEDTNERPLRRIDRMLTQLRQSGMLDGVRGFIFGTMPDCGPTDELCATIGDCLGDLGVPIGFGAPIGHGDEHLAVPLGVRVDLTLGDDGAGGALSGVEPAVG